jgi:crotonobetainyl-CoA:carnitine CoA-transferase CaiB-like acyl-CoA transferase
VNTKPDMVEDPQVRERGFFVPLEPGPTPMPGSPIKMAGLSSDDWTPCPRLGADNAAVLRDWLGYSETRIKALEEAEVLVDRPPA